MMEEMENLENSCGKCEIIFQILHHVLITSHTLFFIQMFSYNRVWYDEASTRNCIEFFLVFIKNQNFKVKVQETQKMGHFNKLKTHLKLG